MNFGYFLFTLLILGNAIDRLNVKLDEQHRQLINVIQLETLKSCNKNTPKVPEK